MTYVNTWKTAQKKAFNAALTNHPECCLAVRAEIDLLVARGASLSEVKEALTQVIERYPLTLEVKR